MWSNKLFQITERDVSVKLRIICAVIRCFNMLGIVCCFYLIET